MNDLTVDHYLALEQRWGSTMELARSEDVYSIAPNNINFLSYTRCGSLRCSFDSIASKRLHMFVSRNRCFIGRRAILSSSSTMDICNTLGLLAFSKTPRRYDLGYYIYIYSEKKASELICHSMGGGHHC